MIDTHFKSEQNQFLHLDTETILSAPLYILPATCERSLRKKEIRDNVLLFTLFFLLTLKVYF